MTVDKRDAVKTLVAELMEDHKAKNGRRFSTHFEGTAHIAAEFENSMTDMNIFAKGIQVIWEMLKAGVFDAEYTEALETMHLHGLMAVESALAMIAMVEKLQGGVVHEPKQNG